jgi:hypothetical protein
MALQITAASSGAKDISVQRNEAQRVEPVRAAQGGARAGGDEFPVEDSAQAQQIGQAQKQRNSGDGRVQPGIVVADAQKLVRQDALEFAAIH